MRNIYFILIIFGIKTAALAQNDSIPSVPDVITDIIEDYIQNTEEEVDFDFNSLYEHLEYYAEKPLNINEASEYELAEFILLTDLQISNFIQYRNKLGDLLSLHELQSVPGFDMQTIRRLLPFVKVKGGLDDYNVPIGKMIYQGKNELYVRWVRTLEDQRGFILADEGNDSTAFLGDPYKVYARYKHSYENKLSYGITMEKDAGEEFFTGSNDKGFDFYSAHFYIKDYNKTIKGAVIGDYAVSMGQGLILYSGFAGGKSSFVMDIKRSGRPIRAYTSVNEANFMRGGAVHLAFGKNIELTTFASLRKRDGNIAIQDTIDQEEGFSTFSSLQFSGFHRTPAEIADKNATEQLSFGGILKYKFNNGHIAFNGLFDKFDKSFQRATDPYNTFYFNGDQLLNLSTDYSYVFRNFHFFGETALSDNGTIASINGLLIGLDRKVDMSILYRHYPRDFQALNAQPFAETNGGLNEQGLYLGLEIKPNYNWKISTYFDTWKHPWLRFKTDAPASGMEGFARITYKRKRKMEAYVQFRMEKKDDNVRFLAIRSNALFKKTRTNLRFHIAHTVSKAFELRSRVEFSFFKIGDKLSDEGFVTSSSDEDDDDDNLDGIADNLFELGETKSRGYMVYQDIIYKPINLPISFTTRLAIFDTDSYESRIYAYENDILLQFTVPPYFNKGTRFYVNVRYDATRNLTLELRYAQTYWSNQDVFGSGNSEIQGQTRSEVKAQLKYQF